MQRISIPLVVISVCTLTLNWGCVSSLDLNRKGITTAVDVQNLVQDNHPHDTPPPPIPSGYSRNVRYAYGSPYVLFPFDGTEYLPFCKRSVDEAVHWMDWIPDSKVTLIGHTDDQGSEVYNQILSIKRAQYVADKLTAAGIDPSRILVDSRGEIEPAVPNTSPGERALNRRVVIRMEPSVVERME